MVSVATSAAPEANAPDDIPRKDKAACFLYVWLKHCAVGFVADQGEAERVAAMVELRPVVLHRCPHERLSAVLTALVGRATGAAHVIVSKRAMNWRAFLVAGDGSVAAMAMTQ